METTNKIKCDTCKEEVGFSNPIPKAWLPIKPAKWECNPCKGVGQ